MDGYHIGIVEPYLSELVYLAEQWAQADDRLGAIECRHFFSGGAAYRHGTIVASLTPVGLAFKVSGEVREALMLRGRVTELRYFPKAPIKREYVLFPPSEDVSAGEAALLILGFDPSADHDA
jgi:hypothetical protein